MPFNKESFLKDFGSTEKWKFIFSQQTLNFGKAWSELVNWSEDVMFGRG